MVLARTVPWPLLTELRTEMYRRNKIRDARHDSDPGEDSTRSDEDIERETIDNWQATWNVSTKGRWTYACIPDIRAWMERGFGDLTYYTTQMLTNHGDFQQYLHRFGRADSPICTLCDSGAEDDAHHTIMVCEALQQPRGEIGASNIPDLVQIMLTAEEKWQLMTRKVGCILKKKRHLRLAQLRQQQLRAQHQDSQQ